MKTDTTDNVYVTWGTKDKRFRRDLSSPEILGWLRISSFEDIEKTEISTHFPPEPYGQTDRVNMPANYQCLGSGSAVYTCKDGRSAYVSLVGFQDTTKHANDSHINFWLWGRTVDRELVHDQNIEGHMLPDSEDLATTIALDKQEKTAVIRRKVKNK